MGCSDLRIVRTDNVQCPMVTPVSELRVIYILHQEGTLKTIGRGFWGVSTPNFLQKSLKVTRKSRGCFSSVFVVLLPTRMVLFCKTRSVTRHTYIHVGNLKKKKKEKNLFILKKKHVYMFRYKKVGETRVLQSATGGLCVSSIPSTFVPLFSVQFEGLASRRFDGPTPPVMTFIENLR